MASYTEGSGPSTPNPAVTTDQSVARNEDVGDGELAQNLTQSPTLTASNPIAFTSEEDAFNVLFKHYSAYELTHDASHSKALDQTIEDIFDAAGMPSDGGTFAFYDFESDLEKADAEKLVGEVMKTYPDTCSFDPEFIIKLHAVMRKGNRGSKSPYQDLLLFLKFAHSRMDANWMDRLEQFVDEVSKAMEDFKTTPAA